MKITEFLLTRIAEDEAAARVDDAVPTPHGCWSPERVLAECEGKRRLVGLAQKALEDNETTPFGGLDAIGDSVLELLALPYADHPDYDKRWRP